MPHCVTGRMWSAKEKNPDDSNYECEVSCYDWYGNARPIFTYGRIFALPGIELIEGTMRNGQITEPGRLSLMSEPANHYPENVILE